MVDQITPPVGKPSKVGKLATPKPIEPIQFGVPAAAPVAAVPVAAAPVAAAETLASPAAVPDALHATHATIVEPVITEGTKTMNETINTAHTTAETVADTTNSAVQDATAKASAFFGGANDRAKDAMAKGTKAIEELVEFSKGNLEAVMSSGRIAAKGAEEIAKYSAEYGRAAVERANATAKQFAAVKSPAEFFQLQGDIAKQTLDAVVAEGSKFTENYLKLMGEVAQPISSRVAVAVDKVKTTTAA